MKRCTKCQEMKNRGCFYARAGVLDGLDSWCKQCRDTSRTDRRARDRAIKAKPPLNVVRLRRMVGVPDEGPTKEMVARWKEQEKELVQAELTEEQAVRKAHSAYVRGDRSPDVVKRERKYQREKKKRHRAEKRGAA